MREPASASTGSPAPTSGERRRDLTNRSFSTTLWKFFGAGSPGGCLSQGAPCGTCLGDEQRVEPLQLLFGEVPDKHPRYPLPGVSLP